MVSRASPDARSHAASQDTYHVERRVTRKHATMREAAREGFPNRTGKIYNTNPAIATAAGAFNISTRLDACKLCHCKTIIINL